MEDNNNSNPTTEETTTPNLREIMVQCLKHWRWYATTIGVAIAAAFIYIKATPPTYKRDASIMVLDAGTESSALGKMLADFTDMGFTFSDKSNANNVMAALQSPDVMREVVTSLGIDVTYTSPAALYDVSLYGTTLPVKVKFRDVKPEESASMCLVINDDGSVIMSDFSKNGKPVGSGNLRCLVGQTVSTPVGTVTISPTEHYAKAKRDFRSINVNKISINNAASRFLGNLSVSLADKKSTILNLSYTDLSTERAEDILNSIINTYNEVWVKNRSRVSNSTARFIDERLAIIERELGLVDADIANYKSKNLVPDIETAYTLSMERADKNSAMLLDLNTRLAVARYIRNYIVDNANNEQLIPVDLGLDNDKIDAQIESYNAIQLERNQMMANSGSQNPLVRDMDKQLAQIRRAIVYSMDNMILSLSTRISHLQNDEQKTYTNISANPSQEQFLLTVERQQKVKEALYLFLLQKREENELARAFNADNTQVIKSPTGSDTPIAPRTAIIMLIAFAAGLALPTIAIYGLMSLDTTVRKRRDVECATAAPILGILPSCPYRPAAGLLAVLGIERLTHSACHIMVSPGHSDTIGEALRMLRVNFDAFLGANSEHNITIVTSPDGNVGKTFITANLGALIAMSGRRTLVIDGNLRHPSLSNLAKGHQLGLADILRNPSLTIEDVIYKSTVCQSLHILPAGIADANPIELLTRDALSTIAEKLCNLYDCVLIDSPALSPMADTTLLAQIAQSTIMVLRAGQTPRSSVSNIERLRQSGHFGNVAIVITDSPDYDGYA